YPAAGMRNYLTRLGWSHGNDEFFSDAQARDWFDLTGIGRLPSAFDTKKLENLCGQHMAVTDDTALVAETTAFLAATGQHRLTDAQAAGLQRAMYCLKERSKTFHQLIEKAQFVLADRPIDYDEKSIASLDFASRNLLRELTPHLQTASWNRDTLETVVADFATANDTKLGKIAQPLRAALAGRSVSPSVFDMMLVLGRDEALARLADVQGISA
ncbi:MAG: glutamate--tRNA ligase, partial [Paracoccaceae bacterium]